MNMKRKDYKNYKLYPVNDKTYWAHYEFKLI